MMNAYELADWLQEKTIYLWDSGDKQYYASPICEGIVPVLRQQANKIAELEKQSEPVGRYYWESVADGVEMAIPSATTPHYMKDDFPLYLAPQTKPLSDEEILNCLNHLEISESGKKHQIQFARAIEAKVRGEK